MTARKAMLGLTTVGVAILALYGGLFMLSMYSSPTLTHLIEILRNWQTFAAGFLAVVAGGLTVWGTWASAMRQVTAVEKAVAQQVGAAERQTDAAQRQTEVMRKTERRRIAREAYAFFAMLNAAMVSIGDDVEAAQGFAKDIPQDGRMKGRGAAPSGTATAQDRSARPPPCAPRARPRDGTPTSRCRSAPPLPRSRHRSGPATAAVDRPA